MKRFAGTVQQLRRLAEEKRLQVQKLLPATTTETHRHTQGYKLTRTHTDTELKCCRYRYSCYENLPQTAASDELQMETAADVAVGAKPGSLSCGKELKGGRGLAAATVLGINERMSERVSWESSQA